MSTRRRLANSTGTAFRSCCSIARPPPGCPFPVSLIENRDGRAASGQHLIAVHGRRRIAFLSGPAGNEDAYWREQGYREALAAHGIPFDPALVASGEFREAAGASGGDRLAGRRAGIRRDFAADDDSAGGALIALAQGGKRVPQDVALVGFDDTLVSRYLTPPLTTVHAPDRAGRPGSGAAAGATDHHRGGRRRRSCSRRNW